MFVKIHNDSSLSGKVAMVSDFYNGNNIESANKNHFKPWQPSSWPDVPENFDGDFFNIIKRIIQETIIDEIENVINDIQENNRNRKNKFEHRGHVVILSLLCAIDTISSYAYTDKNIERCEKCGRSDSVKRKYIAYIKNNFREPYKKYADILYKKFRNEVVHNWNILSVGLSPKNKTDLTEDGILIIGLLDFFEALKDSLNSYYKEILGSRELQSNILERYKKLKEDIRKTSDKY